MAGINNRVPDGAEPDWEGLAGPATPNTGTDVGPKPVKVGPDKSFNGLGKFEDAGFASTQARISRQHENTRTVVAGTGQANTATAKASRGIVEKGGQFAAAGGNAPKRSKSKTTAATADITKPVPLT
jgi:hypothetical protein